MAKFGKYTKGAGKQPKMSRLGNCNGGYSKKTTEKGTMNKHYDTKLTAGGVTAQGHNKSIQVTKDIKRKM